VCLRAAAEAAMSIAIKKILLVTLFCLLPGIKSWAEEFCYFIPPKGWNIANPNALSPRVKIAFLGRSSKGFLPSVNLATEQVNITLAAYIEAVKKIHEADPNSTWRDLGKYNTPIGEGRLTEIETKTQNGPARLMQLIVIKNKTAYILTTGALKEEFPKYYKEFETVLASLNMTSDLTSVIPSPQKRTALQNLKEQLEASLKKAEGSFVTVENPFELNSFQKEAWEPFQKKVISDYSEMGAYWQILLLKDIQNNLITRGEE
jgi:hypothetical protein